MIDLTYAGQPVPVNLSVETVVEATGIRGNHGPVQLPAPPAGAVIIAASYDAAAGTWHILYATPVAP